MDKRSRDFVDIAIYFKFAIITFYLFEFDI